MTKRIAALLAALLLLAGCGAADGWKVRVREQDGIGINMVVTSPVVNVQETAGEDDIGWFLLTEEEFVQQFNELAVANGSPELPEFKKYGDYFGAYIDENIYLILRFSGELSEDKEEYISSISYEPNTETEEKAENSGTYYYCLISMFTESRAKEITDALHMFEASPKGIPNVRLLVCGNVVYHYEVFGGRWLTITAAIDPAWTGPEPEIAIPISPEE